MKLILIFVTSSMAWGQAVSAGSWNSQGAFAPGTPGVPAPTLVSIAVSPSNASQISGSSVSFIATGSYSDGSHQDLTVTAAWTSSAPAVAAIGGLSSTQLVNCVAAGSSTISATQNSISGNAVLTCTAPVTLSSITIAPNTPVIYTNSAAAFTATGNYSDGSHQDLTNTVQWSSSNTGVATLAAAADPQMANCVAAGTSTIKATVGALNSSTVLTCQAPPSTSSSNAYCGPGNVPSFGTSDGSAQLPQSCFYTPRSATPSPGSVINVANGASITTALGSASCGDVVQLAAGGSYSTFTAPAKSCDDNHWITIRTAGYSSLPPEGTRVTPCYAGVSSMAGRPSYPCSSPSNVMAKIVANVSNDRVSFTAGADHYRFIGIEFTRKPSIGIVYNLVDLGTATKVIFDQVWVHGDDDSIGDETNHGVFLDLSSYVAVLDSYFTDLKCISSTGSCQDSQAIYGALGTPTGPWGTYKVVNNFLEASGEVMLMGGGAATAAPADFEIRRNHFFKPLTWDPSDSSYDGGIGGHALMVKNHFELKNGQRVLLEANIFENNWGGFSQVGNSITLTPKSQNNQCPACLVSDVTARYMTIHNVGQVFQIANVPSDSGGWAAGGHNYTLHDIVADGVMWAGCYGCGTYYNELLAATSAPTANLLHDIFINHLTEVLSVQSGESALEVEGPVGTPPPQSNLTWQNSILPAGSYGFMNAGGGSASCAYAPATSAPKLIGCFNNTVFTTNLIPWGKASGGSWGTGQITLTDQNAVGYSDPAGGNYQLLSSSPGHNSATDGKDIGADIATVQNMIAGVN